MLTESQRVRAYHLTFPGFMTRIYANQRMTSAKMGRPLPTYSKQELADWIQSQPHFQQLWDDWVKSGHEKNLSPSVDRIVNTIGYTLTNIQLVTWKENLLNLKKQNKSGEYNGKNGQPVVQMDLDGNDLQTFPTISLAARSLGKGQSSLTNISRVCQGLFSKAYGYKWRYV